MNDQGSTFAGKRVLVTGASGFLGKWLCTGFANTDAEVYRIVRRLESGNDATAFRTFLVDLTNTAQLRDALRECRPDIVFNAAAYGIDHGERERELYEEINATVPGRLCELLGSLFGNRPVRLVHIGSGAEYGRCSGSEITEETIAQPSTLYGITKLAGTRHVVDASLAGKVHGMVARLFAVYGPGEHQGRLLPSLLRGAQLQEPVPLSTGEQKLDFTYIEDVAEGLVKLAMVPVTPGGIVNIATGILTTVRRFSEIAADVLGMQRGMLQFGMLPQRPDEIVHPPVSTTLISNIAQWKPRIGIREGILRTAVKTHMHLHELKVRS